MPIYILWENQEFDLNISGFDFIPVYNRFIFHFLYSKHHDAIFDSQVATFVYLENTTIVQDERYPVSSSVPPSTCTQNFMMIDWVVGTLNRNKQTTYHVYNIKDGLMGSSRENIFYIINLKLIDTEISRIKQKK